MRCAIITGAAGGIGRALVRAFAGAGYAVIASDQVAQPAGLECDSYIACDLKRAIADRDYAHEAFGAFRGALDGRPLAALVNNAAVQVLCPLEELDRAAWRDTLDVNLLAPFFCTQFLLPELEASAGCVLNISSIHARLTKPQFVAYATSKAALSAMTRAMAVELGARVRVNAIEPAAIATPMLEAGFVGKPEARIGLDGCHPVKTIGHPDDLAALALAVAAQASVFLTGSVVAFDGAIGSVLHDLG